MKPTGTIQPGPKLWKLFRSQTPHWIEDQSPYPSWWDIFLGIIALSCAVGTIVLAGAVIAAVLER